VSKFSFWYCMIKLWQPASSRTKNVHFTKNKINEVVKNFIFLKLMMLVFQLILNMTASAPYCLSQDFKIVSKINEQNLNHCSDDMGTALIICQKLKKIQADIKSIMSTLLSITMLSSWGPFQIAQLIYSRNRINNVYNLKTLLHYSTILYMHTLE
jgi:hypothetical protein